MINVSLSLVLKTLGVIAIPFVLLRSFRSIFQGFKALKSGTWRAIFSKPTSTQESILQALAFCWALLQVFTVFRNPPANFFHMTNTSIDAPAFELRNNWRIYLNEWTIREPNLAEVIKTRDERLTKDTPYNTMVTDDPELEREYVRLDRLAEALKTTDRRRRYLQFGEEVYRRCFFCQDDSDYLMVYLPTIAWIYWQFLLTMAVLSWSPNKARSWGVAMFIAGMLAIYEAYVMVAAPAGQVELYDLFFAREPTVTRFVKLNAARRLTFAVSTILLLIINLPYRESPVALSLRAIVNQAEHMVRQTSVLHLQKTAIMQDSLLRKRYFEHHKHTEAEQERIKNDPEFRQVESQLMRNYNIDAMVDQAASTFASIIQ